MHASSDTMGPLPQAAVLPQPESELTSTSPLVKKTAASQRPDFVSVGAEIMHVWDVEMKTCLFSLEMCIYSRWRCPDEDAVKAMEEGGDGLDESWEPDWFPRIKVWNMASELTERQRRFLAFHDNEEPNTATHKSKIWISCETTICCRITEDYDLLAFPFELQDLNIKIEIENCAHIQPIKALPRLRVKTPVMTQIQGVMSLPDFTMNNDVGASYRYRENQLQIVLVYEREFQYYLWNCYVIVGGLATMVLGVYTQAPATRMDIDITLLLVGVTFKVLMSEQLPPVSYLTFLDWYNLVAIFFIFMGCLLHGITSYFAYHHAMDDDELELIDKYCMYTFITGWAIFNFVYVLAVKAQLEVNDAMTEPELIDSNGYAPMQLGEDKPDGTALTFDEAMHREGDETTDSVYGRFAGQGRVRPGQVLGIIWNLMRGIKHKDACGVLKQHSNVAPPIHAVHAGFSSISC